MDFSQLTLILSLAFGLGLLHSLDADHIMAVSNLASSRPDSKNTIRFCLRWAVGHGLTLLFVGLLVFILGLSLPESLSRYAEIVVAMLLIGIGLIVLFEVIRKQAHIHFHQHDGLPAHAHWHRHHQDRSHAHAHTAVLVGMLHGLAGSAPLLALIPIAMSEQPIYGFIYLLIFSLGVLTAMLLFGGLLGMFTSRILKASGGLFRWVRAALGVGAISAGAVILSGMLQ
jgi:cytochrome c biogenesis protein CcdA